MYDDLNELLGKDPYSYDKCCVFPKNIDTFVLNLTFHKSIFTGDNVKICYEEDYKLLHYKYIGRERFVKYNIAGSVKELTKTVE